MANTSHLFWIDNLKGIAILMVIAHHCGLAKQEYYQWYHTGQGVSIFLFCSAYVLANKKDLLSSYRIKKLFHRILAPMLLCTLLLCLISCLFQPVSQVLENCLHGAGLGPGSYFPWMYILFWVSIPLFQKINSKCGNLFMSFLAFAGLCSSLEYTFYLFSKQIEYSTASYIWRVLPLRYLMIIYAGLNFHYLEKLTRVNFSLLFVCGTLAWIDIFTPPILNSYGWLGYHWFTVLYVVPIILILRKVSHAILGILGKYSYDIFLVQMMVFYVVDTFGIGCYPTYWIAFRIIELILIVFFSITIIKIKKAKYYESSKNHSRNRL